MLSRKCEFWLKSVIFFEHIVSVDEIKVDPTKVEAVSAWMEDTNKCTWNQNFSGISRILSEVYRRILEVENTNDATLEEI